MNPQALEHFCVRPDAVVGGDHPKKLTVADLTRDEVPIPIEAWFAKSRFSLDFGPSEGPDFGLVKIVSSVRYWSLLGDDFGIGGVGVKTFQPSPSTNVGARPQFY